MNNYIFYNNRKYIDFNINQLPNTLKYKIYIIAMRLFWRSYIPLYSKVPSWYKQSIYSSNMLYTSIFKNIHFLHLPCNTLPEYKKYILGCQCNFCKSEEGMIDSEKALLYEYLELYNTSFINSMPYTTTKWNHYYYHPFNTEYRVKIFNPYMRNFSDSWINNDSITNDSDSDL